MCVLRRFVAPLALAALVVAALATPASAHATLLTTQPPNGGIYSTPPKAVTLRFNQPVEVSLGGVRVFNGAQERVVTGSPEHPNGVGNTVEVSLPKLSKGTYVVTWRVISEDSHPIEGAFTFQVGSKATLGKQRALGIAAQLLAGSKGSRAVGIVYGIARGALFGALALLIGAVVFIAVVWPRGRRDRRARALVWTGLIACAVTTVAGIALEGVYAAGLPLTKVFDTTLLRDVLDTRYGRVALARLALLALAYPLVRVLLPRQRGRDRLLPRWWYLGAVPVGIGLAATPAFAGHASTGIQVGGAIPADIVHVAAMACWLGGLVVLVAAVLPRRDTDELRGVLPRFSSLALVAIVTLIITGGYQAWRQVGSIDALKSTDYGKMLIVKLLLFAVLIVVAAFSREVVNRRFRYASELGDEDESETNDVHALPRAVLVGASIGWRLPSDAPHGGPPSGDDGDDEGIDDDELDDEGIDRYEMTRLRRSVLLEVVVAVLILAVMAMLVNAAPARSVTTEPVALTLKSPTMWVYVDVAPGIAGPNDMHFTSFPTGGGSATVQDMKVQLTQPGRNLPPLTVPLQKLGVGHYYSPLYNIPYPGTWQMTVRVQTSPTNEIVLVGRFDVR